MNKLRYLISIGLLAFAGSSLGASNCPRPRSPIRWVFPPENFRNSTTLTSMEGSPIAN